MEEKLVIRLKEGDDGEGVLTVEGSNDLLGAVALLIMAAFGDEDAGDCGNEDCPVHGTPAEDEDDLAESA